MLSQGAEGHPGLPGLPGPDGPPVSDTLLLVTYHHTFFHCHPVNLSLNVCEFAEAS